MDYNTFARESVDSLCRDDTDTPMPPYIRKVCNRPNAALHTHCIVDVVLTSKHHEGWCNFKNSYHWNWNSIDEGPKRDLVGDLTASVRKAGLRMGLYHSMREWYNPAYIMVRTIYMYMICTQTLRQM